MSSDPASDFMHHFTAVAEGTLVVMVDRAEHMGEMSRPVGACFHVAMGVISGVATYYGNPTAEEQDRIGKAVFHTCAGLATTYIGYGVAGAGLAAAGAATAAAPAIAVAAGVGFAVFLVSEYSGAAYDLIQAELERLTGVGRFYDLQEDSLRNMAMYTLGWDRRLAGDPWGYFRRAREADPPAPDPPRKDPLMLDLDGDGIETRSVEAGAFFDHDADGFAEQTGWAGPDDGLLVLDRNGNGTIDDGRELFGDQTVLADGRKAANGFEALAEFDSNGDGRIDANDAGFTKLKIWRDSDSNGYSSAGELHALDELSIQSINLSSTPDSTPDAQGNTRARVGTLSGGVSV